MIEILRLFFKVVLFLCFRVQVRGLENYYAAGKRILIVANHVSFLDGVLLAVYLPCRPLFVIHPYVVKTWWIKPFLRLVEYITVDSAAPFYVRSLIHMLESDRPVAIFPEGRITVTGALMKVYQGPGLVADKASAMVLPVYIDGAQYSKFSRLKGVVRQRWFPRIRMTILPAKNIRIDASIKGHARRERAGQLLEDIMRDMVFTAGYYRQTIFESILEAQRVHGNGLMVVEDINRKPASYRTLLRASFALSSALKKPLWHKINVGLMLPNTIPMVVAFLAMHLLGKVPAMLNYTMGISGIASVLRTAEIDAVVTSRKFVELGGLHCLIEEIQKQAEVIYLEEIRETIGLPVKLKALLLSFFPYITWLYSQAIKDPDEAAVVLFTSGSEGEPKGVVLSHENLLTNRQQVTAVINFTASDIMFNAMPLFHSFGFMAGMVLPLTAGVRLFLYPSPLHYNVIPELCYDIRATILFGTNTFLAGYANKAHAYDFNELRLVIAGAEKLQDEIRQLWVEKFGLRVLEGYGTTEASPVISINTLIHVRQGTVGRILPGIDYYLESKEGIEKGGMLHVRGKNIMQGYLMPDNPGVLKPPHTSRGRGWYDTGDIVEVDRLGFVSILGRARRFAKIAGEMVSLAQSEQLAQYCWPDALHAVVAVPDTKRGEQLVLFTTQSDADRKALQDMVRVAGQSELTVPKRIKVISTMPLLGTGKTDYNSIQKIALSL